MRRGAARFRWIITAIEVFILDRATKAAVEAYTPLGYRHTVIPGFFEFVHAANPGVAFGLFATRLRAASPQRWRSPRSWFARC